MKKAEKEKSIYNPIVPAVEQALNILTCLGENSGSIMRLTEICRKVDLCRQMTVGTFFAGVKKEFG